MHGLFSTDMPATRFARNVLLVSVAGLLPPLALYVALTPGLAAALAAGGPAPGRFLRQILTNGLPAVFAVNFIGFVLFARAVERPDRDAGRVLLIDVPARIAAFALVHVAVYVLSAGWFGSFGGSRLTALAVVAPTLARAALFENVSGVYLYATFVSALPLYAHCAGRSARLAALTRRLPAGWGASLTALVLFAVVVIVLTALARLVAGAQTA
jgi:hypothetical protein